jgi:hypothetical protein
MLALLTENVAMAPDTPQAESPAAHRPVYRLNANPPLPVTELRNDELELLVGGSALLKRGQSPDVQAQVDERIRQAWYELKRRGVHEVPVTHWNFGRANHKPVDPRLYDQDWYKRPASVVAAMQNQWWRLLACFNR